MAAASDHGWHRSSGRIALRQRSRSKRQAATSATTSVPRSSTFNCSGEWPSPAALAAVLSLIPKERTRSTNALLDVIPSGGSATVEGSSPQEDGTRQD